MTTLEEKIDKIIVDDKIISMGDKLLVGCSGGPDSVACLHILNNLGKRIGFSVAAAHMNYGLRGEESDKDEEFVRDITRKWNISCFVQCVDLDAYCRSHKLSRQEGGRNLRYCFFQRTLEQIGGQSIAVAHNADDNVETFLMHLIGGTGVTGLLGMKQRREDIIRPLITTTRAEILSYLDSKSISYRMDSSNKSIAYHRNDIRLRLLPLLKEYNPNITETIERLIDILDKENDFMESYIDNIWDKILVSESKDRLVLDARAIGDLPCAIMRRLLRRGIYRVKGDLRRVSYRNVDDVIKHVINAASGNMVHLPDMIVVEKDYSHISIVRTKNHRTSRSETETIPAYQVEMPGRVLKFFGISVALEVLAPEELPVPVQGQAVKQIGLFDYDRLQFPLIMRGWRPGDFFCPEKMSGKRKKIQDFFTDKKIPGYKRRRIPLLFSGKDLVWVVGMRRDERFIVGSETKRVLVVTIEVQADEPVL